MTQKSTGKNSSVLQYRDFRWYLAGVAFSQIGTNGAFVAMLYHVYLLTGSTFQVGVVGAVRGIAIVVLSPWAGHLADRLDRKHLLQFSQVLSMVVIFGLALVTLTDSVQSWHVWVAAMLTSVAATLDSPVRKAIVPAMVPRELLVQAVALVNPTNNVGKLVGPGVAGLLIAWQGPGVMYLVDGLTYIVLVIVLMTINIPPMKMIDRSRGVWSSVGEGFTFVKRRPVIYHLIGLDISASILTAYRVVLPAIAIDHLGIGPTGYGVLSAAPPAGALIGGFIVYRLAQSRIKAGHIVLTTTAAYGLAAVVLAQSISFWMALGAALGLGLLDAIGTTIRHAAVTLETPDGLQGRVQALYGMASRGAPAIGEFNVGWIAGLLGATAALTLGGFVPVAYALAVLIRSPTVRNYATSRAEGEADPPVGDAKRGTESVDEPPSKP